MKRGETWFPRSLVIVSPGDRKWLSAYATKIAIEPVRQELPLRRYYTVNGIGARHPDMILDAGARFPGHSNPSRQTARKNQ